jgi:hypothetical protein
MWGSSVSTDWKAKLSEFVQQKQRFFWSPKLQDKTSFLSSIHHQLFLGSKKTGA